MQTASLKIGTRGSHLALAQAYETRRRLMDAHGLSQNDIEIIIISTTGDRIQDRPLLEIGGKGLFTQDIEEALREGQIDLAVHSAKDMPTLLPEGLYLSAFLKREDPRDAFIGRIVKRLTDLPKGAIIGSSSLRRQALIRHLRPDIQIVMLRGNVETRLRKLEESQMDGILLAYAGLKRLNLDHFVSELLDLTLFPPALGQAAIALESRIGDTLVDTHLAPLNHCETSSAVSCERAFLAELDGSCHTPIAGLATVLGDQLHFSGMILTPDGGEVHKIHGEGSQTDAAAIGREAASQIRIKAGLHFFNNWA